MIRRRRLVVPVALWGTVALAGWGAAARLGVFGSSLIENTRTAERGTTRVATASLITGAGGPLHAAPAGAAASAAAVAESPPRAPEPAVAPATISVPEPATADPDPPEAAGASAADAPALEAPLPASQAPPPEPRIQLAAVSTSDPMKETAKPDARPAETPDECLASETCIDEYLWSLYERTPKVDANKVTERIKETVKKKGKIRTIMKTITKIVVGDFTWKDPTAAERAGMPLKDYVIGGLDRGFKLKLYRALRMMDDAGYMPGITSAFRDDYRQSIATGHKAASDSSYHGGSRRGGYGHALAVDIVSVKGENRLQRSASSEELWKWIDAHEKELGIGRPYLDRDPPHVGPTDGREYADKRGRTGAQNAALQTSNAQETGLAAKKHRLKLVSTRRHMPQPAP